MKITKTRLKQIIKEELESVISEDQFANDPNYVQTGMEYRRGGGQVPVYKRRDIDQHGRPFNPDIDKEPKIYDDRDNVIKLLMQIKGMEQDRAKKIVNDIGQAPKKQLGSYLRMYLSHSERSQIDQQLK